MKEYKIAIYTNQLHLLPEALKYCHITDDTIRYEIGELLAPNEKWYGTKQWITVFAKDDSTLFHFGYWFERARDEQQIEHYDLKDTQDVKVDIPEAFIRLCLAVGTTPKSALEVFAGDVCKHPFITGGSDERMMAEQYFRRHYTVRDNDDALEWICKELDYLRRSWKGNDHQEEFKLQYRQGLIKIFKSKKAKAK